MRREYARRAFQHRRRHFAFGRDSPRRLAGHPDRASLLLRVFPHGHTASHGADLPRPDTVPGGEQRGDAFLGFLAKEADGRRIECNGNAIECKIRTSY